MSELSERVAREHSWGLMEKFAPDEGYHYLEGGCACGADVDGDGQDGIEHTEHVAAMTEAAVRETVATKLEAFESDPLSPNHPHALAPNGVIYLSGVASGIEYAARIARGET